MSVFRWLWPAAFALVLAGCSSQYKDDLVGKWQNTGDAEWTFQFHADGKVVMTRGSETVNGTYRLDFQDKLRIKTDAKIKTKQGSQEDRFETKVSIANRVLTFADNDGRTTTFNKLQ